MQYTMSYKTPIGNVLLAADEEGLTGLWFEGQKYYKYGLEGECRQESTLVLEEAVRWLDAYFAGQKPDVMPPLHVTGTAFQTAVWEILREIPYGQTTTYREIAGKLALRQGRGHMSAQAVGQAVGHNPVSIIIPCHRVVGSGGSLTGYAGGIEKKKRLLALEGVDLSGFFVPKKGSAL